MVTPDPSHSFVRGIFYHAFPQEVNLILEPYLLGDQRGFQLMWKDCLSSPRCERFRPSACLGRYQCGGPCVGGWANVAAGFGYERELLQSGHRPRALATAGTRPNLNGELKKVLDF